LKLSPYKQLINIAYSLWQKSKYSLAVLTLCAIVGCLPTAPNQNLSPHISSVAGDPQQLTVSAASSLQNALNEITSQYHQANHSAGKLTIRYNFGGSGSLQQQIINGAPVDVFIAAAPKQMDALQAQGLIIEHTRRNLLRNRLALITPLDDLAITNLQDLSNPQITRVAIGDPRSVPAGQYAAEALANLGTLTSLQAKFVFGANVQQVLQFVESGNAQAGFVYATDVQTSRKIRVVQMLDSHLHAPIIYPIAILHRSPNQELAKSYLKFLTSKPAKIIFEKYGFSIL
jgi:molybdate transport system substrate-binding protein